MKDCVNKRISVPMTTELVLRLPPAYLPPHLRALSLQCKSENRVVGDVVNKYVLSGSCFGVCGCTGTVMSYRMQVVVFLLYVDILVS